MNHERIALIEYWIFNAKDGDSCTTVVEATGEVLRREQWEHGKSPVVITPGLVPAAEVARWAERRFDVTPKELEALKP